ncbi:MAG: M28 family peptidase [Actinobacteria bacterium]|nr:M28 family peptidase [Actinomycetota bacterium]
MRTTVLCWLLLLLLTACATTPSSTGAPAVPSVTSQAPVPTATPGLAFDGSSALHFAEEQMAFGPRIPGTSAHAGAEAKIRDRLQSLGWRVEEQRFSYKGVGLVNVVAKFGPGPASPTILGAHYDTRPKADRDPSHPEEPVPGANDGASGVGVLLEMARVLSAKPIDRPIWLVFFDGEDSGEIVGWDWIVGSTYFAAHMTATPIAVVVVDMVGDEDLQLYEERNSDPALTQAIWSVAATLGYSAFIPQLKYPMLDDHTPFRKAGLPAVDIIDFDYPPWHTTGDTLDRISASSLEQVGRTLQAWLEQLPR